MKIELQAMTMVAKMHDGALKVPRLQGEDLQTWLRVIIDEDLKKVSLHLKHVLLQRVNDICYLKYLAIFIKMEEHTFKEKVDFIDLFFSNMDKMSMPVV